MKWSGTMSRQTISSFVEGEKIQTSLLITQMNRGITNSGAPYLSFVLQDQSGSIDAKLWDAKDDLLSGVEAGKVVLVSAEVLKYRNALQLRIYSLAKLEDNQFNPSDYVMATDLSLEFMQKRINETLLSMQDVVYRDLCTSIIEDLQEKLYSYPAAAKNHHDFVGGLATHMISMLDLGEAFCTLYPMLNRDLLLAGILLHDLGKIDELSGPILTEYTVEGKLVGHISIMQSKVAEKAKALGYQDSEQVTLMRHMILSHHGEYEFGSPVLPMVMEAEMLTFIDNVDARMNMFAKALESVKPGEWTPRIFPLENRSFYKPKE
jgi:3'-5' exoribonuclease